MFSHIYLKSIALLHIYFFILSLFIHFHVLLLSVLGARLLCTIDSITHIWIYLVLKQTQYRARFFNLTEDVQYFVNLLVRPVPLNQWVHIGASWNRDTVQGQLFVDGKMIKTKSGKSNLGGLDLVSNSHAVYDIGFKRMDGDKFHGYIRDLRVFRKALTEEEMTRVRG